VSVLAYFRLARPTQWSKSAFVLVGPAYHAADVGAWPSAGEAWGALLAAGAFALASSGCYVFNDLADAEEDRQHPRKCKRPIASGEIGAGAARVFGVGLFVVAAGLVGAMAALGVGGPAGTGAALWWVAGLLAAHVVNVLVYSAGLKKIVIADVLSLSLGFVLRVVAGCAAVGIHPSTWLLNATLFLSMFLAFGKRLGERQSLGDGAGAARTVQRRYSPDLLRMLVVTTGVGLLLTYAQYVQSRDGDFAVGLWGGGVGADVGAGGGGLNLLWVTVIPAVYGLMRCFFKLESGSEDDPTELAVRDRPLQLAAGLFVLGTALAAWASRALG
jgi:4-hydroxybenzoate polyprenyltransferase